MEATTIIKTGQGAPSRRYHGGCHQPLEPDRNTPLPPGLRVGGGSRTSFDAALRCSQSSQRSGLESWPGREKRSGNKKQGRPEVQGGRQANTRGRDNYRSAGQEHGVQSKPVAAWRGRPGSLSRNCAQRVSGETRGEREAIHRVGSSSRRGRSAMVVHNAHAFHAPMPSTAPHGRPHRPCLPCSHAAHRTETVVCAHVAHRTQTIMASAAQVVRGTHARSALRAPAGCAAPHCTMATPMGS
jgi:hypothetical protein